MTQIGGSTARWIVNSDVVVLPFAPAAPATGDASHKKHPRRP